MDVPQDASDEALERARLELEARLRVLEERAADLLRS